MKHLLEKITSIDTFVNHAFFQNTFLFNNKKEDEDMEIMFTILYTNHET